MEDVQEGQPEVELVGCGGTGGGGRQQFSGGPQGPDRAAKKRVGPIGAGPVGEACQGAEGQVLHHAPLCHHARLLARLELS